MPYRIMAAAAVALSSLSLVLAAGGNVAVMAVAHENCEAVNLLTARELADAEESYARREENAELLGIELTPALEARLLEEIQKDRTRLRPRQCPFAWAQALPGL